MNQATNSYEILLAALTGRQEFGLRTNPFTPTVVENDNPTRFEYGGGPLNPFAEENRYHLRYYFDVYDWMDPHAVDGLNGDGRLRVFERGSGQKPMIVLISGFQGTGRTSLKNLLLFEIATRSAKEPIVTEIKISLTTDRAQDAQNLASTFVKNFTTPTNMGNVRNALQESIKNWRESRLGSDPNMEFLFQSMRNDVEAAIPDRPIVFCFDATNHATSPDAWRQICKAVALLADFVILFVSDRNQANLSKTILAQSNYQAAWIDAPAVDHGKMGRFLAKRLREERIAAHQHAAAELAPFHPDALKVLFSATQGAGQPENVTLAISFALANLKRAFNNKCNELAAALQAAGGDVEKIDPQCFWISEADMRDAMKA